MGSLIDVKSIVSSKKEELKGRIEALKNNGILPKLVLVIASDDEASKVYVGKKRKMCEELGILQEEYKFESSCTMQEVCDKIIELNNDKSVHGILVQLPLYNHLNETQILDLIDPQKDVDGFHPLNLGKLLIGEKTIVSCTPKGIMTILDSLDEDLTGKNAVVVGRSRIVGKPIAQLLLNRNCTVTSCHSKTKNLEYYTKNADILVVAVGRTGIITSDMIKPGAIVIDVGINRIDGKLYGDVDTNSALERVKYITPVPGGVGLTTVISLMENLVEVAENFGVQ